MNDPIDLNQPPPAPPSAFCQQCGKPLTAETVRRIGTAVFCEPCLAARIGHVAAGSGYGPVHAPAYGSDEWMAARLTKPGPNPGLAALLGLIPGVGAFYNEQYAKGVVHVVVFMVLVSLADHVNGIFYLLVAAWIFYMAIEAHHTARARLDGTPLPNPFGLNDIGERLGFGKAWPAGPSVAEVAKDAAEAATAAAARATTATAAPPPNPPTPPWASPADYNQPPYAPPPASNQAAYSQPFVDAAYAQVYRDAGFGAYPGPQTAPRPTAPAAATADPGFTTQPPPAYPPYAPVPPYNPPDLYDPASYPPPPASRFPAGSIVLIGLGTLLLLTTTGIFSGFPTEALVGCVLIAIGVWIFLRRMTESGLPIANDGTPAYALRLLRALKWAIWLDAIGLLNLLDAFRIVTWHYTWPSLVILLGVSILVQRTAYQAAYNQAFATPPPPSRPFDSTGGPI